MVSAGEELFAECCFDVTMLDVVKRAGAPRGSIYHHFPDGKSDLALAVLRRTRHEIEDYVDQVAARSSDAAALLIRIMDRHRKRLVASDYRHGCPLMGMVITGCDLPDEVADALDETFAAWVVSISRALQKKGLPPAGADQLARLTVTGIEGCTVLARGRRTTQAFDDFADAIPALVRSAAAPES